MIKSILAVSEGGPDAVMSFRLAARVAAAFDGAVDALHLPVGPAGGMAGGLAMSGEAMPLLIDIDDSRLEAGEMVQGAFTWVIPILLVVTIPASVIAKGFTTWHLPLVCLGASVFGLIVSRLVFVWSLKSYRSASS